DPRGPQAGSRLPLRWPTGLRRPRLDRARRPGAGSRSFLLLSPGQSRSGLPLADAGPRPGARVRRLLFLRRAPGVAPPFSVPLRGRPRRGGVRDLPPPETALARARVRGDRRSEARSGRRAPMTAGSAEPVDRMPEAPAQNGVLSDVELDLAR